eukprot:UN13548
MGDTWSWGISSDPWKNTAFRIAMRKRAQCLESNLCSYDSASFYNFSRLLLKNGEHTWGGGVTHFLTLPDNYYAWSNKAFQKRLHSLSHKSMETVRIKLSPDAISMNFIFDSIIYLFK